MNPSTVLLLFLAATAGALLVIVVRAVRRTLSRNRQSARSAEQPPIRSAVQSPVAVPMTADTVESPSVELPSVERPVLAPPAGPPIVVADLAPPTGAETQTLTDLLDGIRLPYDLMPVTSAVEDADRHIVFLTTHSNAGEVGRKFADELERLGYELETIDVDQAVATRGDDIISMKIVPQAHQVEIAERPRYGAAGPGDVALETWIGRSPVPPSAPE